MSNTSKAERKALEYFSTLPFRITPAQTFAPYLSEKYFDATPSELEGRPDALCIQPGSFTFIEVKSGILNSMRDKQSSHRALQHEYTLRMHDGVDKPYNFLTAYFEKSDSDILRRYAWNQSLYKVLALQTLHGFERYIVCFKRNPSAADAARYAEAGLVFCTEASATQLLARIELAAHGLYIPFTLTAPRSEYHVVVNLSPNPDYAGLDVDQINSTARAKYEATVALAEADELAARAEIAADLAAGILPF